MRTPLSESLFNPKGLLPPQPGRNRWTHGQGRWLLVQLVAFLISALLYDPWDFLTVRSHSALSMVW